MKMDMESMMDVLSSPWNDAKCDENLHHPNIAVYLQINMTLDFSIFRILFNKGKLAMTDHCKVQKNMVVLAPCVMFRFYFFDTKISVSEIRGDFCLFVHFCILSP